MRCCWCVVLVLACCGRLVFVCASASTECDSPDGMESAGHSTTPSSMSSIWNLRLAVVARVCARIASHERGRVMRAGGRFP
jgi:hypothetical protein